MTTIGDQQFHDRPGTGEASGRELLYESLRTRVTRVTGADAGSVISKERLGPGAVKAARRERAILALLADVDGVARLADVPAAENVVTLQDVGGTVLAESGRSAYFEVPALLKLATGLADIVAGVHRRGVVHKDINPSNIMVLDEARGPLLIDFDLATTFAEERPGFTHQSQIAGTLAYLAPEQTGRTGRAVDQRADLYALGATLYKLATGQTPFGDGDTLRLIHAHLAQVPQPPATLNPTLPQGLSDIILRLLEKEPDGRYQSAEGLSYDLARLCQRQESGDGAPFPLGECDFPLRLSPPSRLVGRAAEIETLRTAFAQAMHGKGRGVLVTGAPGVGKTALIDELRLTATTSQGWFVTGKFDQYRQDVRTDAVAQAMRALGRLLLAEPEAQLVALRAHILQALGTNAGLLAAVLPEFGLLLGVTPDIGSDNPVEMEARLFQGGLDLLRAVITPARPIVMVIDDLQWAGSTPVGFIDAVLTDEGLSGLLLVGAYREAELDAAHPLSAVLTRWERLGLAPPVIHLQNLPRTDLGTLLAEMLRLPPSRAAELAEAVGARTDGNPYDTVELVNALRHDGALVPGGDGWHWDPAALRRYVGKGDVVDLLSARIDRLVTPAQAVLEIMACLGGVVDVSVLQAASGRSAEALEEDLTPCLEDGLLLTAAAEDLDGEGTVRFRHDRVQQAAYARVDPPRQRLLHRTLARRLALSPGSASIAAQQYLPAVDDVDDPAERRRVAVLFQDAAAGMHLINYAAAERFLTAAMGLLATAPDAETDPLLGALERDQHMALYRLGRLPEADEAYRTIERRRPAVLDLATSACVQISSLTNRGLTGDAVALALDMLRRLGLSVPASREMAAEVQRGLDALYRWVGEDGRADDVLRPEISDPRMRAAAQIISRAMPPAFFSDQTIMAWLVTEARRLWTEHGPHAALVGPLSHACVVTIALRQDYRTGYRAVRHVLAVSEARGYEPETSQARFLFSVSAGHWFEPLEDDISEAQRAHEGLLHGGDLQFACFTYHTSTPSLFDCAPTLEVYAAEVDAGITFAARTGNEQTNASSLAFRQLVRTLRGETNAPGSFQDQEFDEADYLADVAGNPMATAYFHITRATAAALFGHAAELAGHAAAAVALLPFIESHYSTSRAYLLQALALADRARVAAPADRAAALTELDACRDWLALRAADAPGNYLHLLRWVDAERAWAVGDLARAAAAFDAALRDAPQRRPWHQGLIAERAAGFHVQQGLHYVGRQLLADAMRRYREWGASAKVRQLEQDHSFLRTADVRRRDSSMHTIAASSESIDLLAVLRASQALSSETSLDRLRARVVEVLTAMTGATKVQVVLWDDNAKGWFLPPTHTDGPAVPLADAGARGLVPLTAFLYVERTREPLLVDDVTRDDRFARDPYVAALDHCSLLVVPILTQGAPRAVLLLENRLSRGAFSTDRLDAVMLIAGQLAVSLDNAMVYASLERKVTERTEALATANEHLSLLSTTDPLTGLANRRHLAEILESEWRRGVRSKAPLAVAMVDIDHFKSYNDHYGHLAGDACLRRVADALNDTVRTTDLVARYGGEEFLVILPDAPTGAAREVAERARAAVVALAEPHAGSATGVITISIGVAGTVPTANLAAERLVEAADAELYDAKRSGRNRVCGRELDVFVEAGAPAGPPNGHLIAKATASPIQDVGL
jgi:diguanylate cyclase (GGDEF)-like protein